jgi:acetamidase/formamidase
MAERAYEIDYRLGSRERNVHTTWDNSLTPALTVESGSVIRFECSNVAEPHVTMETTVDDLDLRGEPSHPLTGPVAVEGATPGDVLAVEFLSFQHKGWGYTLFPPGDQGRGLLPEEFPDPGLHVWELEGDVGHFVNGIEVPLDPFPGVVGVAPAEDGAHATFPPRSVGGNIDVKHLTAGSTLYLPVEVDDALFSIGDCHGAQGDGEVCVTALEAPMFVTARLSVRSDMEIDQPQFRTTGPFTPTGADEPMYATTGISDDLMDATKRATRAMLDYLHEERGLTRTEAYLLASVAVDLKLSEVVDAPNWVVSAYLPESIFPD